MQLIRLDKNNARFYDDAINLYINSFPLCERRDITSHKIALSYSDYHFDFIIKDNKFIGIMLYWETNEFIFLEHFAILPSLRNNGFGQSALNLLKEKNKTIILEIEPPIDDLTIRRLNFYKRNDFYLTNHNHIQLKYHKNDNDLILKIMSFPLPINEKEYKLFRNYLNEKVQHE